MHRITKHLILAGQQCPKKLWLLHHSAEAQMLSLGDDDLRKQSEDFKLFGKQLWTGQAVVRRNMFAAQSVMPQLQDRMDGVYFDIPFEHKGLFSKADALVVEDGRCEMFKFKSSTRVKTHHLSDCAVDAWLAQESGCQIDAVKVVVANGNQSFDGDPRSVLKIEDVTERIRPIIALVPQWVQDAHCILEGDLPEVEVGGQCGTPHDCPFRQMCRPVTQVEYPLSILGRSNELADLASQGISDVRDIPEKTLKSAYAERLRRITASGIAEVDPAAETLLGSFGFPRYYLDFEAAQSGNPRFEGVRPFQQLPFQWSCHVEDTKGSMRHIEFLDLSGSNPMRAFAETLIDGLGTTGPVFVFSTFERDRLRELAACFTDLAPAIEQILHRLVDLLPVVRRYYYDPAMKGLFSIKIVLPTIAPELDYADLQEVANGRAAQSAYFEAISPTVDPVRKADLRTKLLRYCRRDTAGLVALAHFLEGRLNRQAILSLC